jgi:hypothetical protein
MVRSLVMCGLSPRGARAFAFTALLVAAGCRREPPERRGPAEIVPIDPAGLARLRAAERAPRPQPAPALRVFTWRARPTQSEPSSAGLIAAQNFPGALERRLAMLDAWSPRAEPLADGVRLTFALGHATLPSLVREQLVRPGRIELVAAAPCPRIQPAPALPGLDWRALDGDDPTVPVVHPNVDGVAPLAPLRALFSLARLPPPLRWAHGSLRDRGAISRRGFCVRGDHPMPAPSFSSLRATRDPATLLPMLEVILDAQGHRATLQTLALFPPAHPPTLLLTVDDEVMGPVTLERSDAGPSTLRVVPNSRMGSISPELVGALWRSGPIPIPFTIEEELPAAAPGPGAPPR